MKRLPVYVLALVILTTTSSVMADGSLQQYKEDTDSLWRTGVGAEDGAYSAISASMLGWGIGLAAAIAIVASVLHSGSSSSHAHAHTCQ